MTFLLLKPWILLSLAALFLCGGGNFLMRLANIQGQSFSAIMTSIFLTNFIFGLVLFSVFKPDLLASPKGFVTSLFAAVFLAGAILCLNLAFGQPEVKAGIATALLNMNFVFVALLSFFILKETLTLKQIIGLLTVLAGSFLLL